MVLSAAQKATLSAIKKFVGERGYPPTRRELSEQLRISMSAVERRLVGLERKRAIRCDAGVVRGIVVIG